MNEKLAKKLGKLLAKAGLDEDKINEILSEVDDAVTEEGVQDDVNPENAQPGEGAVPSDEVVEEGAGEGAPSDLPIPPTEEVVGQVDDQVAPTEEETVPPTDGSIESALDELAAQEGGQVPPTEPIAPEQPQVPIVDPTLVSQLQNDLGEALKTIDGLSARIQSLEESLKTAGVITDGGSQLGDENRPLGQSANHDAGADAFDDILAKLNGR